MKLKAAVRLLQLLPTHAERALTTGEIVERWATSGAEPVDIRTVQRYMCDLSEDGADGPALVNVVMRKGERRFFLRLSQVSHWFMSEEDALNLLWSRQALAQSFAAINPDQAARGQLLAQKVATADPHTRRLRDRLRLVPNGIGRLPAKVAREVLVSVVDAIGAGQLISFDYVSTAGKASSHARSPQGLVAKDGSLYLLATEGLCDPPLAFALHRMKSTSVLPRPMTQRLDFDLDRYIADTHQLSHKLQADAPPIQLKLRVSPNDLFHFKERPLAANQQIGAPDAADGWCLVSAEVPDTVQLLPFLASFGEVEVLSPPELRQRIGRWLHKAAAHYGSVAHADAPAPTAQTSHAGEPGSNHGAIPRRPGPCASEAATRSPQTAN